MSANPNITPTRPSSAGRAGSRKPAPASATMTKETVINSILDNENTTQMEKMYLRMLLEHHLLEVKNGVLQFRPSVTSEDLAAIKKQLKDDFDDQEIRTGYAKNRRIPQTLAEKTNIQTARAYKADRRKRRKEQILGDFKTEQGRRINPETIKPHMDLFEKGVIDPMLKKDQKAFRDALDSIDTKFIKMGAYGSTLHKDQSKDALKDVSEAFADKAHGIRAQAMQQAAQMFYADKDAALDAIAGRDRIDQNREDLEHYEEGIEEQKAAQEQIERQNILDAHRESWEKDHNRGSQIFEQLINLKNGTIPPPQKYVRKSPFLMDYENKKGEGLARGGQVMNKAKLKKAAKQLQKQGRHGDTILAHISPEESALLMMNGGSGTINPETGLPEYFRFKDLLPAIAAFALPYAAPYILPASWTAAMAASPMLTAALTGAATKVAFNGGKGSVGMDLLTGGLGGMTGKGIGDLGLSLFGAGSAGAGAGLSNPSALGVLKGGAAIPASATPLSPGMAKLMSTAANPATGFWATPTGALMSSAGNLLKSPALGNVLGGLGGVSALMNASTNASNAKESRKMAQKQIEEEKEVVREMLKKQDLDAAERKALEAKMRELEAAEDAREAAFYKNEADRKKALDDQLKDVRFGYAQSYAKGGNVKRLGFFKGGYLKSDDSGVKDNLHVELPEGSYVMDAMSVAGLGDGNSDAGVKMLEKLLSLQKRKALKRGHEVVIDMPIDAQNFVPALVSGGEYVINPEQVRLFSERNNHQDGIRALEKIRKNLKSKIKKADFGEATTIRVA